MDLNSTGQKDLNYVRGHFTLFISPVQNYDRATKEKARQSMLYMLYSSNALGTVIQQASI